MFSKSLHPERFMDAAGVRFGDHVADIGPGRSGHLVFPLSERVGEDGKVYALDIQSEALDMIEGLRRQRMAKNLHTVWGDVEDYGSVPIPEGSLDVAFLLNTMWTFKRHMNAISEISRLVKDEGRVLVMEWRPGAVHPLAPPSQFLLHPEIADTYFAHADLYPMHEIRLSPHHWVRTYERL